jgi:hypothetical protein
MHPWPNFASAPWVMIGKRVVQPSVPARPRRASRFRCARRGIVADPDGDPDYHILMLPVLGVVGDHKEHASHARREKD